MLYPLTSVLLVLVVETPGSGCFSRRSLLSRRSRRSGSFRLASGDASTPPAERPRGTKLSVDELPKSLSCRPLDLMRSPTEALGSTNGSCLGNAGLRLRRNQIQAATRPKNASPPMTPPTIAPTGVLFGLEAPGVDVEPDGVDVV